jgi:hypothetical protein
MVCLGERDDKLASTLVTGIHSNTSSCEALRVHQRDKLIQQVRLSFEEVGRLLFDGSLETLRIVTRDSIPGLRLTPMHCIELASDVKRNDGWLTEVDAVGIVILLIVVSELVILHEPEHTSLCQQNVEKTMPTYVHGTVMPEMSDLM